MNYGLSETALESIRAVMARHPAVREALIFGSRALGRAHRRSDVDLALRGELGPLEAEAIAIELDDLPLPVRFDVHLADLIRHRELREQIDRAGQIFYRRSAPAGDKRAIQIGNR